MEYDDIIVGAGSCGAVLAARLSEDPQRSVLLIEAGPDYTTISQMPRDLLDPHGLRSARTIGAWSPRRLPIVRFHIRGKAAMLRGISMVLDYWEDLELKVPELRRRQREARRRCGIVEALSTQNRARTSRLQTS